MSDVPRRMMLATGWFQIGWSGDFPTEGLVTVHCFGQQLVVVRNDAGHLHALDAYCGHMGAHLGHGGTVCDGRIVCPFHGWEWDAAGANVAIPYQDRPNRAVRLRTWPVVERNGIVYVWHHHRGDPPTWAVPDAFAVLGPAVAAQRYHDSHPEGEIRFGIRPLNPFVVLDNAADPAHFRTVHQTKSIPTVVTSDPDGHLFRVKLGFGSRWVTDPDHAEGDALDIVEAGVGLSYTALGGRHSPFVVILLATTPVDDATSTMFQTVWLEEAPGDGEPGRLDERRHEATHQLPRDIEIWEHQRYLERPAWAANEVRGFTALRRWAAGFVPTDDELVTASIPAGAH